MNSRRKYVRKSWKPRAKRLVMLSGDAEAGVLTGLQPKAQRSRAGNDSGFDISPEVIRSRAVDVAVAAVLAVIADSAVATPKRGVDHGADHAAIKQVLNFGAIAADCKLVPTRNGKVDRAGR